MTHYAHILSVNRLQLDAYIGFYEAERMKQQPVEVSFRLYFAGAIASNHEDCAAFFDYGVLCDVLRETITGRQFNLIEFLAMELFRALRTYLDAHAGAKVRLWLELNKIQAPVPGLLGGATFIHSDLPADATFIPSGAVMILLGLGSNLGDRADFLAQAKAAMVAYDIDIIAESYVHETPALLPPGAPPEWNIPYLNQVVSVATHHAPLNLLSCLKDIELELGSGARCALGAAEIDLDILAYHDVIMVEDALVIPHQHLDEREFVLRPIYEVAPDWRHPIFDKTAKEMLAELKQ